MHISVVGCGPRGLAVALYAQVRGHTVTVLDPWALSTWSAQALVPELEMRSPLTFDLVTYLEDLQEFSLATFLGIPQTFSTDQFTVEGSTTKVPRSAFCSYLFSIRAYLEGKVRFIPMKVVRVLGNTVFLEDGSIVRGDAVVFAPGYAGTANNPVWLKNTKLSSLVTTVPTILRSPSNFYNKSLLVVGSGQGAAEVVDYLCTLSDTVTWVTSRKPRVSQYPAPTTRVWGSLSALGPHYRGLTTVQERQTYLGRVKAWQPSITPYIAQRLSTRSYEPLVINSFEDIDEVATEGIVLAAGVQPSLSAIPATLVPDTYFPSMPAISESFRLVTPQETRWYVTGILATTFDGPRQHSLLSAGITAREIIRNIEDNSGSI